MGFKAIALDYLMDNGMADDAPKTALAMYSPDATGMQGSFIKPVSAQSDAATQPDTTTPQDEGNGMTSFERESRGSAGSATPESQAPENQQTQAEKEMRDSARNIAQGQTVPPGQGGEQAPQQPQVPSEKKPFFGPQPNGDLRIGDDVYLRWKKLPGVANALIAGGAVSGVPTWIGKGVAGYYGEQYLDENLRWPWFTYEPNHNDQGRSGGTLQNGSAESKNQGR